MAAAATGREYIAGLPEWRGHAGGECGVVGRG